MGKLGQSLFPTVALQCLLHMAHSCGCAAISGTLHTQHQSCLFLTLTSFWHPPFLFLGGSDSEDFLAVGASFTLVIQLSGKESVSILQTVFCHKGSDVEDFLPVVDNGIVLLYHEIPSTIYVNNFEGLKVNSNQEAPYFKYLIHHFKTLITCILPREERSCLS